MDDVYYMSKEEKEIVLKRLMEDDYECNWSEGERLELQACEDGLQF